MFTPYIIELASKGSTTFYVRVRSGMSKTCVQSIMDDESIKIHVGAKAINGRANAELKRYLAEEFGVSKENVKMLSGATSRVKLIRITNH